MSNCRQPVGLVARGGAPGWRPRSTEPDGVGSSGEGSSKASRGPRLSDVTAALRNWLRSTSARSASAPQRLAAATPSKSDNCVAMGTSLASTRIPSSANAQNGSESATLSTWERLHSLHASPSEACWQAQFREVILPSDGATTTEDSDEDSSAVRNTKHPSEIVLDVGFALLTVSRASEMQNSLHQESTEQFCANAQPFKIQVRSHVRDGVEEKVTDEGLDALLGFIDQIFDLPELRHGFTFVCDLTTSPWPQPNLVFRLQRRAQRVKRHAQRLTRHAQRLKHHVLPVAQVSRNETTFVRFFSVTQLPSHTKPSSK